MMIDVLPDCMAPDGAEPCDGYRALLDHNAKLETKNKSLKRRLEAAEARLKWQPIETAPKGIEVQGALRSTTGRYLLRPIKRVKEHDHEFECDGFEIANCWDITHWMPLPEPPKDQALEEQDDNAN